MVTWAARQKGRNAKHAGRRAADSRPMRLLARAGLTARGVLYLVIGWIAVLIAFGKSNQQADRTGALHIIGKSPPGEIALWLLVAGFAGMVIWRLFEAVFGSTDPEGQKRSTRLAAVAWAAMYAVITYGILIYALGIGSPQSGDQQSVDLTATAMREPGGRVIIILVGLGLTGGGIAVVYSALRKRFLKRLSAGQMRAGTRRIVEWLGRVGGSARGVVFVTAGIFLIVAAVQAQPQQAKGIDSALRALAQTPLGPWLLLAVAIGLIMFGAYSCCEARWRRF